jgi:hypothetical protein
MSNRKELFYVFVVILLCVGLVVVHNDKQYPVEVVKSEPKPPPKKDTCPHYITVASIKSEYKGAWRGDQITLTDSDGIEHVAGDTNYYKGQKVCINDL